MSDVLRKVIQEPAKPLRPTPAKGGANSMAAVTPIPSPTTEQITAHLASLSNQDKAALLISAILAGKHGRKF